MILTCPACATSYFVDDARVPAEGRKVKCTSCGNRWVARPEASAPPEPAPDPSPPASSAAPSAEDLEIVAVEREPEPEAAVATEAEPEPAPKPKRTPPRRAAPTARARAEGRSSVMVWAGAAALAAALIAGVIVFRQEVVRLWPSSSAAYAGLGLAVDGGGLVLEHVHVEPAFLGGRPVLSVTGAIRNVRDQAVEAPPVRVTLLNRAGKPVAAKIARPLDATVPAHAERHFAIAIADPPANAHDLEVHFVTGREAKAPPRAEAVLAPAPEAATPAEPLSPTAPERG
jgi:predicted Zn finger-like uncharacterized protein